MSRKTPDLSLHASNDFDNDFGDLDDIIEKESGYNGTPDPTPTQTNNNNNYNDDFGDDWWSNDSTVTPPTQQPSSFDQSNNSPSYNGTDDPILNELENALEDAVGSDEVTDKTQQPVGGANNTFSNEDLINNQQPTSDEDPYILALNLMQEFDLIRLPEGMDYSNIDAKTLAAYKDYTLQLQHEEALNQVRSRMAHDPSMLRLFDYAYNGGEFANLPLMADAIQEEMDFVSFPIDSPENQKYLMELYLSEGLDEYDPRDRKLLEAIPEQIEKLYNNKELSQEALNAKRYFVERARDKAIAEEERIYRELQQEEYHRQLEEQEIRQWDNEFRQSLMNRKWSDMKKKEVATEASYVTLNTGEQMPLWQYKQQLILSDPYLFQEFLDFTSRFDMNTGQFNYHDSQGAEENQPIPQGMLNSLVERLQKKGIKPYGTTNGQGGRNTQGGSTQKKTNPVVNVKNNWF